MRLLGLILALGAVMFGVLISTGEFHLILENRSPDREQGSDSGNQPRLGLPIVFRWVESRAFSRSAGCALVYNAGRTGRISWTRLKSVFRETIFRNHRGIRGY